MSTTTVKTSKTMEDKVAKLETDMDFLKKGMMTLLEKGKKKKGGLIVKIQKPREIKNISAMHVLEDTIKKAILSIVVVENKDDTTGPVIQLLYKNFEELAEKIAATPVGKPVDIAIYKMNNEIAVLNDDKWVVSN